MQTKKDLKIGGMILAAGFGKRLRPITDQIPKALVTMGSETLLDLAIRKLTRAGALPIIINIHHKGQMIQEHLKKKYPKRCDLILSDETEKILDTGGGIQKAFQLSSASVDFLLVHNVDIISAFSLDQIMESARNSSSKAVLLVQKRKASRKLLIHNNKLVGWKNMASQEQILVHDNEAEGEAFAFQGIHITHRDLFEIGNIHPFPLIPHYIKMAAHHSISTIEDTSGYFFDVGSAEKLHSAKTFFRINP